MTREQLKERVDDLTDEEVEVLSAMFGPSEDELALRSESLQAELRAAQRGELRGIPLAEVLQRLGLGQLSA